MKCFVLLMFDVHFQMERETMEEVLISIIVPVFKVENELRRCLNSICNQTYQNLEMILIDDGSPDCCGEICDEYATYDSRIQVIHKKNGGLSDARNVGIKAATGDFIVCIDSDDWVEEHHIEWLYHRVLETKSDIAVCGFGMSSFAKANFVQPKKVKAIIYSPMEAIEEMFYNTKFSTSAWGKMYRRTLFQGIEYPIGVLYEDMPTTYRLFLRANQIVYSNENTYLYYQRTNSIGNSELTEKHLVGLEHSESLLHRFCNDIKVTEAVKCIYMDRAMAYFLQAENSQEVFLERIWDLVRMLRISTIANPQCPLRLRMFALLSFFGMKFAKCICTFYFENCTNR